MSSASPDPAAEQLREAGSQASGSMKLQRAPVEHPRAAAAADSPSDRRATASVSTGLGADPADLSLRCASHAPRRPACRIAPPRPPCLRQGEPLRRRPAETAAHTRAPGPRTCAAVRWPGTGRTEPARSRHAAAREPPCAVSVGQRLFALLEVGVGERDHRLVQIGVVHDLADLDAARGCARSLPALPCSPGRARRTAPRFGSARWPAAARYRGAAAWAALRLQPGIGARDRRRGRSAACPAPRQCQGPAAPRVRQSTGSIRWVVSSFRGRAPALGRRHVGPPRRAPEVVKLSPTICCSISSILAFTPAVGLGAAHLASASSLTSESMQLGRAAQRGQLLCSKGPRGAPCAACRTHACARSRCASCARSSP